MVADAVARRSFNFCHAEPREASIRFRGIGVASDYTPASFVF
jgi:hypothetical protein